LHDHPIGYNHGSRAARSAYERSAVIEWILQGRSTRQSPSAKAYTREQRLLRVTGGAPWVISRHRLRVRHARHWPPAAAGGRLMGLTQEKIVHAIGIYVAGGTAINQTRVGILSNWKACASAEASRNAIFAAELAQASMTGPNEVFEGATAELQPVDC
jgi:hypothetical protein